MPRVCQGYGEGETFCASLFAAWDCARSCHVSNAVHSPGLDDDVFIGPMGPRSPKEFLNACLGKQIRQQLRRQRESHVVSAGLKICNASLDCADAVQANLVPGLTLLENT